MSEDNGHYGEKVIEEIRSLAIPPGWARTSVGEVGEVRLGRQRSPKNRSAEFPTKYVRAANITWNGLDLSDVLDMDFRPSELASYRLQPGDVLLSEASGSAGEVGKPAIWNGELEDCCFQNTVIRFRPKAVSSKFALVAFQHFARNSVFARVSKGVGIHHLSADRFASMPFLLPPTKEQDRIVAEIEELTSDLDAGIAALMRAKANLKRYRAAVLKAAVEGKLTEEWRAKHPAKEPASILLARILKGRRQKWEADQLAKFAAAEKEPPKNWREKYVEPSPPMTTGLPELPEGWCWTRMELLACDKANSIGAGPFGTIFKAHDFRPEGIPIIFLRHVQPGVYLTRKPGFMDQQKWEELFKNEYSVFGGELLVTKLGEPPGTAAIYPNELGPAMVTPDVIKMLPSNDVVLTEFVMYYMNSSIGRAFSSGVAFGTTRLRLTLPLFKDLPVPLPPLEEQTEIVAEIAEAFSQIEAAETAIEHGLLRASRLRQSILKQAFEGKLVPQDPKDEPASVLLKRLQASRSVHEGNGKAGTQNRTRGRRAKSKQLEGRADE